MKLKRKDTKQSKREGALARRGQDHLMWSNRLAQFEKSPNFGIEPESSAMVRRLERKISCAAQDIGVLSQRLSTIQYI